MFLFHIDILAYHTCQFTEDQLPTYNAEFKVMPLFFCLEHEDYTSNNGSLGVLHFIIALSPL